MQIYLVGAHGAGKTTLAKAISHVMGLKYQPEVVKELLELRSELMRRDFESKYGSVTRSLSSVNKSEKASLVEAKETWKVLNEYEHSTLQALLYFWFKRLQRMKGFVTDRSLIDVLAYTSYVYDSKIKEPLLRASVGCLIEELMDVRNHDVRNDTLYIHCVRRRFDDDIQMAIHNRVTSTLALLGIKNIERSTMSVDNKGPFFITYDMDAWKIEDISSWVKHLIENYLIGFLNKDKKHTCHMCTR